MASTDVVPRRPDDDGSALGGFLNRCTDYEKAGAVIPRDLLQFGLVGSIVVIVTGILAFIVPSPESIRQGDFYLVLGGTAADIGEIMRALAVPAILCGLALLGLDLYLMEGRRSEHWRGAVVAQAAAGGLGGFVGVIFLALILLNLVLWILIAAVVTACCLALLAGLASGS
jgi:hypothetical protein